MNIELVCNPASGSGTTRDEVIAALRRHGATVAEVEPERIVVAGGDGTIGTAAEHARQLGVPLAVLPTGTANDFARAHGLPEELDAAARLAATGTQTRSLELGYAGEHPFVNVAAMGLAPQAARRAEPFKRFLGPVAYIVGALGAAVLDRPVRCAARVDGEEVFSGEAWQVMVACTGAFGGGSDIDSADPADGRLDLVILPAGSRFALPRYGAALRTGSIAEHSGTLHRRGGVVDLAVSEDTQFNLDGEVLRTGGDLHFSVQRDAVRLIVQSG